MLIQETREEPETVAEEQKKAVDTTFELVSVDEGVTVRKETTTLLANATMTGDGQRTISLDEEKDVDTFAVPGEDAIYARFKADAWDLVEELMQEEAVETDTDQLSAWDLVNALRFRKQELDFPVVEDVVPDVIVAETTERETVSVAMPENPFPAVLRTTLPNREEYERPEEQKLLYGYDPNAHESTVIQEPERPGGELLEARDEAVEFALGGSTAYTEELEENPLLELLEQEGKPLWTLSRERVAVAAYEPERTEHGTSMAIAYRVEEEAVSVKDSLLNLVDSGELDATIVKQPFYSIEAFVDGDGDYHEAGWQDGFDGVIQLEGMEVDVTEFSYGSNPENMELGMDSISKEQVSSDDYVSFRASEDYSHGAAQETGAYEEAWDERYGEGTFDRFNSDTERGVYAAMMDGNEFEGSPLDLSLYKEAREAYIEDTGLAPENVLENVIY